MVLIATTFTANANVDGAVDNFFNSITADVSGPSYVHDQSAGVISAGGFATRSQAVDLQLGYITPPSFNTSCGNMNFYSGSFTFMTNTDQLLSFLKNTLMTAGITAVMTALKSATPNIAGTLQSMIDQANQLMGMFNNSCQLGTALGSMAGTQMSDAISKSSSQSLKDSADASSAFINNTLGGGAQKITDNMKKVTDAYQNWVNSGGTGDTSDENIQKFQETYGSIIWKGMQSNAHFMIPSGSGQAGVVDLANLIVSLTGDVMIYSPSDNGTAIKSAKVPPTITDIKQFLTGKSKNLEVYACTGFNPQKPVECKGQRDDKLGTYVYTKAPFAGNMMTKIENATKHIQDHFVNDTALTTEDMFVISISPIPIYAIAQTLDDIGMATSINSVLAKYQKQIAFEILSRLVNMSMEVAIQAMVGRTNPMTINQIDLLQKRIENIQEQINTMSADYSNAKDPVQILQELNYLKSYAQNLTSPEIMQRINFAKQLNNY